MRVDNLPFLACFGVQSGRLSTLIILRHLGTFLLCRHLGTLLAECGRRRLLRDGDGDLGVAAAGALGACLHGEGEHEAIAGPCVGGHDESGVRRAFLPQRQVLGARIARRVHGDIPMRIEALVVGIGCILLAFVELFIRRERA